jgi:O-antigen/teichoic acid export membrane protein
MQSTESGVRRNIAVMVAASIANAITGATLMFLVPRLMSVNDFGYWRTFILYAGFAGFAHLGLVDGALLHWSQIQESNPSVALRRSTLPLLLLHLSVGVTALGLFFLPINLQHFHAILVAILVYAWAFNLLGLAQVNLQAQGRFNAVAVAMSASVVLFLGLLVLFHPHSISVNRILFLYLTAWCVVAASVWLAAQFSTRSSAGPQTRRDRISMRRRLLEEGRWHIQAGWPIMLANIGYGLMQSADRITVNFARPIHDFAIYSLAQSTIYVPVTIISSLSRVAFSHFAVTGVENRNGTYANTVRLLTLAWAVLLPYYYLVEWVVLRFLPKYSAGLPAGRILLFSILFLSLISVVQANAASVAGRQRQFFVSSVVATVFAFVTAWIGSRYFNSLTAVAWSQVIAAAAWWLANEFWMAPRRVLAAADILRVLSTFAMAALVLYFCEGSFVSLLLKPLFYFVAAALPLFLLYRHALDRQVRQRSEFTSTR